MKYVRQFGSIWELPEQKFKELLEAGAKAKSYNLNDYGRMIIHRDDIIEPLDWRHSDFKSKLQDYLQRKKTEKGKARVDGYFNGNHQRHSSKMTDRLNTRRIPKDSVEPQFATILALKGALVVELRGGLNKSINRLGS